jgi:hypothetical protein
VPDSPETLALMATIDATFLDCPWYSIRQMTRHLRPIRLWGWRRFTSGRGPPPITPELGFFEVSRLLLANLSQA